MKLPHLTKGIILKRYKRFFADVEFDDGSVGIAHCPNTGSMRSCWEPGAPAEVSFSDNPKRKLKWTLERVDMGNGWVGVNTHRTNPVIHEALKKGVISSISVYDQIKPEVKMEYRAEKARLDFMLTTQDQPDAYVEVKNVTLWDPHAYGHVLTFPDAVTERGRKHLEFLSSLAGQGKRAIMLYALNRPEGEAFSPADKIDPAYGEALRKAKEGGVELIALRIRHDAVGMSVAEEVPVRLD